MCFSDEPGQDAGRGKEAADLRVASVASRVWSAEGGGCAVGRWHGRFAAGARGRCLAKASVPGTPPSANTSQNRRLGELFQAAQPACPLQRRPHSV